MKETKRMSAAQRRARQRKQRNRRIAMTVALVLVVALASIGGTIAWLTATTGSVVNTFTVGDINIDLYEHTYDPDTNTLSTGNDTNSITRIGISTYKIRPSVDLPKDPTVVVNANSEPCWLFVKVEEVNWPDAVETNSTTRKVNYEIATGWTPLDNVPGVYYREVSSATNAQTFEVLKDNKVTVSENLTKADVKAITNAPTLTFTAYACQKEGMTGSTDAEKAAAAWAKIGN